MTDAVLAVIRTLAAIVLAMLPRRYWPRLDAKLPVSAAAPAAALLTSLAGAAIGIPGFFAYLDDLTSRNSILYLDAAVAAQTEELPLPSGLSVLALFTFVLLTPEGLFSSYLALTGAVRLAGTQFDDPHGDFMLTIADAGARRAGHAVARRAEIDNRRLLEGPMVRDRVAHGAQFGLPDTKLVIVASRLKPGWDPGVVVLSERGVFRIALAEDRMVGQQLRRIYALTPHEDLEVLRRTVSYEFPGSEAG